MNCEQKFRRTLFRAAFALACLSSAAASALAQGSAKPAMDKWRPKDGVYADTGVTFAERCGEFGDTIIALAEKSISGGEEGCKITKLTDTAPGAIKLDLACTDIEREKPYKEIILLKRIDDKTIFLRETQNGKFKRPGGQMSYCPEEAQRSYTESKARDRAEAERKAVEERSRPKP